MKAYLNKAGEMLLLTLDSENETEADIFREVARSIPILHLQASGEDLGGTVRLQYGVETKDKGDWEIKSN